MGIIITIMKYPPLRLDLVMLFDLPEYHITSIDSELLHGTIKKTAILSHQEITC